MSILTDLDGLAMPGEDPLDGIVLGRARAHQNMRVFPLTIDSGNTSYKFMDEVMEDAGFRVEEISNVNTARVVNDTDYSVLLFQGEELRGAKQDRIVFRSVLIGSKSTVNIPVSCVEHYRWSYPQFDNVDDTVKFPLGFTGGLSAAASLRAEVSYCSAFSSDSSQYQSNVWEVVDAIHTDTGTGSATRAMKDSYTNRKVDIDEYLHTFQYYPDTINGFVVFIDGVFAGLDLFSRRLPDSVITKIISGYALDAIREDDPVNRVVRASTARRILSSLISIERIRGKSHDMGEYHIITDTKYTGGLLTMGDELIWFSGFPVVEGRTNRKYSTSDIWKMVRDNLSNTAAYTNTYSVS